MNKDMGFWMIKNHKKILSLCFSSFYVFRQPISLLIKNHVIGICEFVPDSLCYFFYTTSVCWSAFTNIFNNLSHTWRLINCGQFLMLQEASNRIKWATPAKEVTLVSVLFAILSSQYFWSLIRNFKNIFIIQYFQ